MPILTALPAGTQILREMNEFAQIPIDAQRYIRRSLDVAAERWERLAETTRNETERRSINRQIELYSRLDTIRAAIPAINDHEGGARFIGMAADLTYFDLSQQKIRSLVAYRFLYERLLGAAARPWLLSVFVMCATFGPFAPSLHLELLNSLNERSMAGLHSMLEPRFIPDWVNRLHG